MPVNELKTLGKIGEVS